MTETRPRRLRRSRSAPPVGESTRRRRRRSDPRPRRQREVAQRRERRVRLVASPTSESGTVPVREHGRDANAIVLGDQGRRVGVEPNAAEPRRGSSATRTQSRAALSVHARRPRGPSRGKSRAEGEVHALVGGSGAIAGAFTRRGAEPARPVASAVASAPVGEIGNAQRPRRPAAVPAIPDEPAPVAVAVDVPRTGHPPARAVSLEPARIAREDPVEPGFEPEPGPAPGPESQSRSPAGRVLRRRGPRPEPAPAPAERAVRREGRGVHHRGASLHSGEEIAHAVDGFGEEREAGSPGARGGGVRFRDLAGGRSEGENFSEATRRAHGDGLDGAELDALRGEENGGEGGDVQDEVGPPSGGREGGGEGYLAVKRGGFHVDEGGGDLEATTRAVLIGEANLEGDVLPRGDHQLEYQVGLLQTDCEGGEGGGRGTPESQAGSGVRAREGRSVAPSDAAREERETDGSRGREDTHVLCARPSGAASCGPGRRRWCTRIP